MSVYTWIIIGLTAGWPVMFCSGLGIGHYIGRDDGYEECRADAAEKMLTERRAAAPRHARPASRDQEGAAASPPGPFPLVPAARPPWYRHVPPRERTWTDAASIMPVMWAAPGTQLPYRPQPSGVSGNPDTGTLPRIKLTGDDDTGEIRAIGAAMVAAIEEGRI